MLIIILCHERKCYTNCAYAHRHRKEFEKQFKITAYMLYLLNSTA